MKKFISLFTVLNIIISMLGTFTVFAEESGTYKDTMTWTLDDNGTLTISGMGAVAYDPNDPMEFNQLPWNENRDKITQIIFEEGITGIEGEWTFAELENLQSITFPKSITVIGYEAFMNCPVLTSVTIPAGVKEIGDRAFGLCKSLTEINVNEDNPYYSSLDGVLCNKEQTEIIQFPVGRSDTTYIFPESITSIGHAAFEWDSNLTSIIFPDSIKSIGFYAFEGCENLADISIGSGVAEIGWNVFASTAYYNDETKWDNNVLYLDNCLIEAKREISGAYEIKSGTRVIADRVFYNCRDLTGITIPDSVKSIGDEAFSNSGLTSIIIPSGVTSIGISVFAGCNLTEVNVDAGNTAYISEDGVLLNKEKTELVCYPKNKSNTSYKIPDGVKSIVAQTFYLCWNLTDIEIPSSVNEIGDSAFYCSGITSIIIPDSVKSIEMNAFMFCSNLTSAIIGNNVESIGSCAFYSCSELETVTIGSKVKEIGGSAFSGCDKLKDIYYNGSREEWEKISIPGNDNTEIENAIKHYNTNSKYDYSIKYENEKAVVTVPQDDTYTIIFASYEGDRLLSVNIQNISLVKGENPPISPQNFNANGKVKVMLCDSLKTMKPLAKNEIR